jgi:SAM-dependent methyltransferase
MSHYQYGGEELAVFAHAKKWKRYLQRLIGPELAGDVLEVGAGLGSTTRAFLTDQQASWTCMEPDPVLAARLSRAVAGFGARVAVRVGTILDVPASSRYDCILYVDVLEHIQDDHAELNRAAELLRPAGRLVVLSPAHQFLFTRFDANIGHYRRYNRAMIRALAPQGLRLERIAYLDAAGLLLSLANRLVLRSDAPSLGQVLLWDRVFVPMSTIVDPILGRRVGKSILAVWKNDRTATEHTGASSERVHV